MRSNSLEKGHGAIAMDVERFSKQGTEELQQGHLQQAMEAFTNAYKSSQALGNHSYMQRACAFNLGALLLSMGRFNDGLHYLNLAKPAEGCKDGRSNGDLYFNFGLAYEGLKKIPESKHYFEKALEEYHSEHTNLKMEADTTRRLGQLCVSSGQFAEAEAWMKQLIQAYENLGEKENRYQAEAERANILLKMGKIEEAEDLADDCLKGAKLLMSPRLGNVFNELGLVYTQMTQYEKAMDSDQHALNLLKSSTSDADAKLLAVLYQNMGALYNYLSQFQEAVEFHRTAIEKHAELKNRKSQGHCFINLGYAYSQLKQLDKAGESFLHATQAARDCGDKKSEWQSLEAMGSVAYNQGDLRRAQEFYRQAVSAAGHSTEVCDKDVQERILSKLTRVIQEQLQKPAAMKPAKHSLATLKTLPVEQSEKQTTSNTVEDEPAEKSSADHLEGTERVIKIRRGSKIKHMKIRRSGTLRQFKKFALGLDISRPNTAELKAWPRKDDDSVLSAETIDEHDVDEEEDGSDSEDSETIPKRPAKQGVESPGGIEADNDSDDESGDDYRKVQAEMEKVASLNDADTPGTSGFVSQTVSADVHAKAQDVASSSEDEDSSDLDSSDESDEESTPQKKAVAPPVPSMSPPVTGEATNVRTYERATQRDRHYETIDHFNKPSSATEGERSISLRKASDDDGFNFFHADGEKLDKRIKQAQKGSDPQGQDLKMGERQTGSARGTTSASVDGTVYESMRPASRQGRPPTGSGLEVDSAGQRAGYGTFPSPSENRETGVVEEEEEEDSLQSMSRGQRDIFLYSKHKADAEGRDNPGAAPEVKEGDQKNSKHCIVM